MDEVADLLARLKQQRKDVEQINEEVVAPGDIVHASVVVNFNLTADEIKGVLRARVAESVRLLGNIGINVENAA